MSASATTRSSRPGSFLFLDSGTSDFGLVRDSVLNARNVSRLHVETLEQLAVTGVDVDRGLHGRVDGSRGADRTLGCPSSLCSA